MFIREFYRKARLAVLDKIFIHRLSHRATPHSSPSPPNIALAHIG